MGSSRRIGKQCRERWFNHLNPDINRNPWTEEEDLVILEKQKAKGNRWSDISKGLTGRTENAVKNRFNCLIKKAKDEEILSE
jgi:myb proto-oncogene protein